MRVTLLLLTLFGCRVLVAFGEDEFERAPIEYSLSRPANCVSRLQSKIGRGEAELKYEEGLGYLRSLLSALDVPAESQTLVFSKTSMQRNRISPRTPRAIYFNDQVYLGFCQAGNVIEIAAADPQLGAVFYTLDQKRAADAISMPASPPAFVRQTENCLQCHAASASGGIPALLARSLFVDASGLPILSEGGHRVDHTTPIEDRWGGWYVTGTHGKQSHLGNVVFRDSKVPRPFKNEQGLNVTDLSDRFSTGDYLTPHSDIVALLVLEHQVFVHNLLTKANFAARQALHNEAELNAALGEPPGNRLASTTSRIKNAGDKLVEGLLFAGEAPIKSPISGSSAFAQRFAAAGPRDSQGRSLREFDLCNRMFKYPCSYLIYSPLFDQLPLEMKVYVASRLHDVLTGKVQDKAFAHLSADDRQAIREIVGETKPGLWSLNRAVEGP
jgi:hypothetical protein